MEFEIYLITNKYLGDKKFCIKLFKFLQKNDLIIPQKIGDFEPLKTEFNESEFAKLWNQNSSRSNNVILWKSGKKNKSYGMCEYGKGTNFPIFNKISFSIQFKNLKKAR